MYRNEINEMGHSELVVVIKDNDLDINLDEYIDGDMVIESLEYNQGRVFESAEDDILDSICNGNWTFGVEQMLELSVYPDSLIDYIEDYRYEVFDEAYEWFKLEHAVAITEMFYRTRKVA